MSKLEKSTEDFVVRHAKTLGIESTKLNVLGRRGEPDRIFWVKGGRPLIIEFKRKGKRPTKLQQRKIDYLLKRGYDVQVCDNKEEGIAIITGARWPWPSK